MPELFTYFDTIVGRHLGQLRVEIITEYTQQDHRRHINMPEQLPTLVLSVYPKDNDTGMLFLL